MPELERSIVLSNGRNIGKSIIFCFSCKLIVVLKRHIAYKPMSTRAKQVEPFFFKCSQIPKFHCYSKDPKNASNTVKISDSTDFDLKKNKSGVSFSKNYILLTIYHCLLFRYFLNFRVPSV